MSHQRISDRQLNLLGLAVLAAAFLPCLLLGEGSVVQPGDQLDGEVLAYRYGARDLFSGRAWIPDYLGGVRREALFPPAPLLVLFYRFLPPFAAFAAGAALAAVAGFFGMQALLRQLSCGRRIAFVTALCFALLPFYAVYGLSVAGLPLLLWAFLRLRALGGAGERRIGAYAAPLGAVALYAAASSFVLIGYAAGGAFALACLALALGRRRRRYVGCYAACAGLLGFYLLVNRNLAAQVLGLGQGEESHKLDYVLHAQPFFQSAGELFWHGSGHAPSLHGWMIVPAFALLVWGVRRCRGWEAAQRRRFAWFAACLGLALGIAAFYGVYHGGALTDLRQRLGGFWVYFQIDRVYWFYPLLWYLMLGLGVSLWQSAGAGTRKLRGAVTVCALGLAAGAVLWNSDGKRDLRQLWNPETSHAVTWQRYYGTEVFAQIREAIGRDPASYRVASVGLDPAVAAYNGFYTVDGYSNNYARSYKAAFRDVIAGELEKDEALRRYFDDWGNRCYLFSAELGQTYYFEKESGAHIRELAVDTERLRALGCSYVFAGVPVDNAAELGWTLLGSFTAEETDCRYEIRVYALEPSAAGRASEAGKEEAHGERTAGRV